MANDDVIDKLEEWKQKYYESLASLEQQQSYDQLLERSIGRLALAAQGLDTALDKQLKSLREALRKKSGQQEIEQVLEKIETALSRMEETKTKESSTTAGEIIADLLQSLKLHKPFKSEAKHLIKKLKPASNAQVSALIPEVLTILERSIHAAGVPSKPSGFGFQLFGLGKSSKEDHIVLDDRQLDGVETELDNSSDDKEMPVHMVLMQLLERLSLPTDLSKKATQIRHQIENGLEDDDVPQVINAIADIISTLGYQVIAEKQDYEAFLKTLTTRLNELDQHIRDSSEDDIKAFQDRQTIGQKVEDEVSGIRNHVADAHDLETLKLTVSERLEFLSQHLDGYRKADHNRFKQSQKQIQQLNQKLQSMEQETIELRKTAEQSRDLALKDALTGIWNRQALNEILEREYARWQRYQKPLSIVVWDIDLFKRVNDSYGHAAGDKVLKTIARIFQQATRDADFIARFGGEEFVGVFPETRLEDALVLANKIRVKVETSKFHYENKPVPITASAGLSTFRPNDTIEDVFNRADKALYRAKEQGRNCCIAD